MIARASRFLPPVLLYPLSGPATTMRRLSRLDVSQCRPRCIFVHFVYLSHALASIPSFIRSWTLRPARVHICISTLCYWNAALAGLIRCTRCIYGLDNLLYLVALPSRCNGLLEYEPLFAALNHECRTSQLPKGLSYSLASSGSEPPFRRVSLGAHRDHSVPGRFQPVQVLDGSSSEAAVIRP